MVRATLREIDPKTQTRRALRLQPPAETVSFCTYHHPDPRVHHWAFDGGSLLDFAVPCPYGERGDRLYGKETFFAWGRWETRFSAQKGRDERHFVDQTIESGRSYRYAATDEAPPLAPACRRHRLVVEAPCHLHAAHVQPHSAGGHARAR